MRGIAADLYTALDEKENPVKDLHSQIICLWKPNTLDDALRLGQEAYSLSVKRQDLYGQAASNFHLALVYFLKGHHYWSRSAEHFKHSARQFQTYGLHREKGTANFARAIILELVSRRYADRWHEAMEEYLEACYSLSTAPSPLLKTAERRYKKVATLFSLRKDRRYPGMPQSPGKNSSEEMGGQPSTEQMPDLKGALENRSNGLAFSYLPYFQWIIVMDVLLGLALLLVLIDKVDNFWLAMFTGLAIFFFAPFFYMATVSIIAGQLICIIPTDCCGVFQFRRGELGVEPAKGGLTWVWPFIEQVRAIVPIDRLSYDIFPIEFDTVGAVHVVVRARGTYQVRDPIRLVGSFPRDVGGYFLGVPRAIGRELTCKEIEDGIRCSIRDAMSQEMGDITAIETLQKAAKINDTGRLRAESLALVRGIILFRDLEIKFYVG